MPSDFVMCARKVKNKQFISEPGESKYLLVPEAGLPSPSQAQTDKVWAKEVVAQASTGKNERGGRTGDLLFFVHGFNTNQEVVMRRHRKIKDNLAELGYKGAVVSFDWPSGDLALAYLEDRHDAKQAAFQLVKDGIFLLTKMLEPECQINIHILAHSMGAYVVREAFDDADDSDAAFSNWTVSQIMLIAGDISANSLSAGDSSSKSLYRHCIRLTNYANKHDAALALSNVKRVGVAPRVGRHGLPGDAPEKAVNVDCSDYFETIPPEQEIIGDPTHSWHIGDPVFMRDMLLTIQGAPRDGIPTRIRKADGGLALQRPLLM
jgi:esterase/lipase superfamily enzyme